MRYLHPLSYHPPQIDIAETKEEHAIAEARVKRMALLG